MANLVLDAGPLIGVERNSMQALGWLKEAHRRQQTLAVSTATIAEIWRGGAGSARVARLLKTIDIVVVDQDISRQAGELLAAIGKSDTIDAILVATARRLNCPVLTGDPGDVGPLAERAGVTMLTY